MKLQKNVKNVKLLHCSCAALAEKGSLDSQILKDLVALHPQSRQAKFTLNSITRLARQLPHIIKGDGIACLCDEWKALQNEPIPSNWYETGKF